MVSVLDSVRLCMGAAELNQVINEFGLSANQLARDSGIGASKISAYRNYKRNLDGNNIIKLIKALPFKARIRLCELCFFDNENLDLEGAMSDNKTNFARFLAEWMDREKISFEELFLNLQARTPLDRETLTKIMLGEIQPDIYQLTFLGIVLTKEDGTQYSLRELTQIRDGINHNNGCDNHYSNDHTHS